jgi:hypothetical protein
MTSVEPDAGGLADLRARLLGGVHAAVAAGRPADFSFRDQEAFRHWADDLAGALEHVRDGAWSRSGQPQEMITTLAGQMRKQGDLLAVVVFSPQLVLNRLLQSCGSSGQHLIDTWIGMCWVAEAAWSALRDDPTGNGGYTPAEVALLRPLAARVRFLVLSEPMRWRGKAGGTWWGREPDQQFGGSGALDLTFGPGSWPVVAGRCQEARREWRAFLDSYQSHPLLSQAKPNELEQELRALVFRNTRLTPSGLLAQPLGLSVAPLAERSRLTTEDKAMIADVAECHLLPRFAVTAVVRLSLYDDDSPRRWEQRLAAAAVLLAGLTAVGLAALLLIRPAAVAAAVCYLLICAGVLWFPASWGAMWLLRMPAASAIGIIALVSLQPGAWVHIPLKGWVAVAALTGVSFGYLLIEVRNHGAARRSAALRALLVALIGAVHALMVSLIGLVAVAPAFVANGADLDKLWTRPTYGHAGTALALAAAWCLAVGVFSQILWYDRPITAPLAHLSWRSRP